MRYKLSIIIFLYLLNATAQVKFGKVTKEELSVLNSESDEDAPAKIISKVGEYIVELDKFTNDYRVSKKVTVRIKIYDKERTPSRFLNVRIPIYNTDLINERVSKIKAITYNLVGDKIIETRLNKKDIFREQKNDYVEVVKFAFPSVKNGSVVEYKYTMDSPRFYDLETWYFQSTIPIKYSKLSVKYPKYFSYSKDMRGFVTDDSKPVFTTDYNYDNRIDEVIYKNVPAIDKEPFVLNSNNLMSSIRYELKEYDRLGYGYKNFSMHWEAIMADLYNDINYARELKGNAFLNEDVSQFEHLDNKKKRLEAIFEFVKKTYSWDQYYGLFPRNGVRKTYKEKSGNGTDLNFILIAMLDQAGIHAHPIVISTVSNGILNSFPSKRKLDHTIAGVQIEGNLYLMDALDPYSQINRLPEEDLNFFGFMLLEDDKYEKVSLENTLLSEIKSKLIYSINDDVIHGKLDEVRTNYFAKDHIIDKMQNASFDKQLMSDYDIDVLNVKSNVNAKKTSIRSVIQFEDSKSLEYIANKLLIKPFLFNTEKVEDLKSNVSERNFPIEFGTPFNKVNYIKLEIPQGYISQELPESIRVLLSNNIGGYTIIFEEKNNHIIIKSSFQITKSILPAEYYGEIVELYQKVNEKENESIIFKKL